MSSDTRGFSTKAIHAGQDPLQWNHGAVVPPLVMSTTFQQDAPALHRVNIKIIEYLKFFFNRSCVFLTYISTLNLQLMAIILLIQSFS